MNPFEKVWCDNIDSDERDVRFIPRWVLWRARVKRMLGLRLGYGDCWRPLS